MDEFPTSKDSEVELLRTYREAIKIIRVFPTLPIDVLLDHIHKYNGLNESDRMINVVNDLLGIDGSDSEATIRSDVDIIQTIFPQLCYSDIVKRLSNYYNNNNRIKLVIHDIVNEHENNINKVETITSNKLPQETTQMPSNKRKVAVVDKLIKKQIRLHSYPPTNIEEMAQNMNAYLNNGFAEDEAENIVNNKQIKIEDAPTTIEGAPNEFDDLYHLNQAGASTSSAQFFNNCKDNSKKNMIYVQKLEPINSFLYMSKESKGKLKKEKKVREMNGKLLIDLTGPEHDTINFNYQQSNSINNNTKLFNQLMEIFPEAEPDFLRNIILKQPNMQIDDLITEILALDYPKRNTILEEEFEIDQEMHYEILKQVLPDADPMYLRQELEQITSKEEIEAFLSESLDRHDYPKYKDYLRKQQLSSQAKQYTTEFSVENFLAIIPDPINYFNGPEIKAANVKDSLAFFHASVFLKSQYVLLPVKTIRSVLMASHNILTACSKLDNIKHDLLKNSRKVTDVWKEIPMDNIPLLQLFAYIKNKDNIIDYVKNKEKQLENERRIAKETGLMQTCYCCCDDEVMQRDMISCPSGCMSCKLCVSRSIEIAFGEGKVDFLCLQDCGSQYTIQSIQSAIQPKLFSKVAQKKQLEEVKAAGIEDLEFCPFCDFANIPAPGYKIFKCLNPECMKESCRDCKEPSHVPLKCTEVEKDSEVKLRTYIENKMTEALLRKCWKCGMKFIKSDGCNKMTCTCGAMMCYICNKPVTDYKHFNGQGGERFDLCPLYSDTNELHKVAVLKSAQAAKMEMNINELKIDPTADVTKHYKEWKKKNPSRIPPGM